METILQHNEIETEIETLEDEWNASLNGDYLWSNVNFGEAVSEVMTPLSWTVLRAVFGEYVILPGYESVGNIGGWPYLNISLFASLFHALGRSQQKMLDSQAGTLYMKLPEGMQIPLIPLSKRYLLSALPKIIQSRIKERKGVRDLPAYLETNPAWFRGMRTRIQRIEAKAELHALWRKEIWPHVSTGLWSVMGSVNSSTAYTMKLRRELDELVGPEDANILISNLSDESGMLASLGPVVGIARVARGEMESEEYLEVYGHRGADEFELSLPRPAEDPQWMEQQLAQYDKSPVDVEALLAEQRNAFEAAMERLRIKHPRRVSMLRRRVGESAQRARMRELARSEYVRDRWLIRQFALRAGELSGLGDDIFFLTLDKVLAVLRGDEISTAAIPSRKEIYNRFRALPPYPAIILGRFDPYQWAADPNRQSDLYYSPGSFHVMGDKSGDCNLITGSPGSAGRVEGLVRRIDAPEEGEQLLEGEVLVAAQTDIAWTLLFPRAAAVVTDVGAPLSHAAIVARELGIPAVVGCGDATMRLATGDRVRVDGARGIVEIVGD
jgi:phosphoenolpyruvate synthase/pyruvate phosphate dikinase